MTTEAIVEARSTLRNIKLLQQRVALARHAWADATAAVKDQTEQHVTPYQEIAKARKKDFDRELHALMELIDEAPMPELPLFAHAEQEPEGVTH